MAPQQGLWWTARNAWEYRQLEAVVDRLKGQYQRDPERIGESGLSDWDAMCIVEGLPSCPQEKKPGLAGERPELRPGAGAGTGVRSSGRRGGGGGSNGGGSAGGAGADGAMGVGLTNLHLSAEEVYARARRRIEITFAGLRQALDSLVPLRGHKALLFVSEGFILIPSMPGYTELLDTARRANVAVHFLDPRGLESGYGGDEPPGLGWATRRNLDMAGADDIAGATGGRSFVSNDPGVGLRQVAAESEVYYLLGYTPGAQKPGERKVKVRVTRDGLSVRARSRYYVENPEKAAARRDEAGKKDEALGHTPEERAAMRSLADTTELPLRVTTLQFDPTATGEVTTLCAAEVRLPADATGTRKIAAVERGAPARRRRRGARRVRAGGARRAGRAGDRLAAVADAARRLAAAAARAGHGERAHRHRDPHVRGAGAAGPASLDADRDARAREGRRPRPAAHRPGPHVPPGPGPLLPVPGPRCSVRRDRARAARGRELGAAPRRPGRPRVRADAASGRRRTAACHGSWASRSRGWSPETTPSASACGTT